MNVNQGLFRNRRANASPLPVRYRIVGMIFFLALINHVDRANISIAAPAMIRELGWDEARFGVIFSAFLWGYTVLQLPGGYLADRVATLVMALGVSAQPLFLEVNSSYPANASSTALTPRS